MSQNGTSAGEGRATGFELDRIVLPVREGVTPNLRPPVRIFLGTEAAQYRADRVLVWSIEKVRDPSRVYEVTLLQDLPGFDRSRWTTSFTNYRFAIPHLLGGRGRAIYNDEDQVYLTDPAELFDLDMADHGYLAVSDTDTSVMLVDAGKMVEVWPLAASQKRSKRSLLRRASQVPGLYGALDGAWNVRDDEVDAEAARCLHFTTLHTQPWRPFPDRFVYDHHPDENIWFELEREANQAGFRLFGRDTPSRTFVANAVACDEVVKPAPTAGVEAESEEAVRRLVAAFDAEDVLEVGSGTERTEDAEKPRWGAQGHRHRSLADWLAEAGLERDADGVVCLDLLSQLPQRDVPWIVDTFFDRARSFVFARVCCQAPERAVGGRGPPAGTEGGPLWWRFVFESAAARRPGVHWELALENDPRFPGVPSSTLRGGASPGAVCPRIWVLDDGDSGHREASRALADALGWPFELKRTTATDFGSLVPPWPDLAIAAGPAAAAASKHVRRSARGRTLCVQLGDEGSDPASDFDLSVVSSSARRFPHPQRIELDGPVVRADTSEAVQDESLPGPRIVLLAGADSKQHAWDAGFAARIGADTLRLTGEIGGVALAATVAPLAGPVEAAFREALSGARAVAPGGAQGVGLKKWLGLGDVFVVAGDDDALLARVCATGRPVLIYPVPRRACSGRQGVADGFRNWVFRSSRVRPLNRRGTTRPQKWNELRCSRWLERGWIDPVPEPARFHERLVEGGRAGFFGDPVPPTSEALREVETVAQRVREMLGRRPSEAAR